MSRVEILTIAERKELFILYHRYLVACKENNQKPVLIEFLDDLINNNNTFSKFTSKIIANRLEQERLKDGIVLWPKIVNLRKDINNYQPPSLENHINLNQKPLPIPALPIGHYFLWQVPAAAADFECAGIACSSEPV